MALKVFISHSVAPRELGIVYAMANEAAKRGASSFIADRDWDAKGEIPQRIKMQLKKSDYLLAIATSFGFQNEWLNREVIEGAKARKQLLIVADKGIKVFPEKKVIWIDRTNPARTIKLVSEHLAKFGKDKKTKELLTWIGVGGIFYLLLLGKER